MNIPWALIFKIATGIIVVPLSIAMRAVWPWWENASLPIKILSGPLVLPLAGIIFLVAPWWNDL